MPGGRVMPGEPLVTVVVPTRNAARTLARCLDSITRQDHRAVEIVVVDNGSSDDTVSIARRYTSLVVEYGPERSAQRNHGARLASGDPLLFVDADMVLEPSVVRACCEALSNSDSDSDGIGAVIVPEHSFGTGYFARCRALEKALCVGDERVEAARAFTAQAFASVAGYDESLNAFEDWDLDDRVRAAGWRVARARSTIWHDDGTVSPLRQFRKKRYYGVQGARYLAAGARRRPVVRSSLWSRPQLLRAEPWLVPGLVWLKLCESTGIAVGALDMKMGAMQEHAQRMQS